MSTDDNKRLVRVYYEEVVSTGDVGRVPSFISPDYVEVYQNTRHALGIEGAEAHVRGVRRTYPDLVLRVEHQIAEGDWVVTLVTARGTQRGEWLGIPPSGRPVEFTAVNVDRIESDLTALDATGNAVSKDKRGGPALSPGYWF